MVSRILQNDEIRSHLCDWYNTIGQNKVHVHFGGMN